MINIFRLFCLASCLVANISGAMQYVPELPKLEWFWGGQGSETAIQVKNTSVFGADMDSLFEKNQE